MTEPMLPSAAERLAALRAPTNKRTKPANTSKILAAGLSTTALFGLVTAMGWQSGAGSAQATAAPPAVAAPTTVVSPALAESTVAPLVPAVPAPAAPVVVPIVTPVAVPVAQPAAQAAASNTTTKASG